MFDKTKDQSTEDTVAESAHPDWVARGEFDRRVQVIAVAVERRCGHDRRKTWTGKISEFARRFFGKGTPTAPAAPNPAVNVSAPQRQAADIAKASGKLFVGTRKPPERPDPGEDVDPDTYYKGWNTPAGDRDFPA